MGLPGREESLISLAVSIQWMIVMDGQTYRHPPMASTALTHTVVQYKDKEKLYISIKNNADTVVAVSDRKRCRTIQKFTLFITGTSQA